MSVANIPGVQMCAPLNITRPELRAKEAEGDPHNQGLSSKGNLVRRSTASQIVVDRDADGGVPHALEAVQSCTANAEREAPAPTIDRGPSLENRNYGADVEIAVDSPGPPLLKESAPAPQPVAAAPPPVQAAPPPVSQPTIAAAAPPPVSPSVSQQRTKIPIVLESETMGRHRLKVDVFSASDNAVLIGYGLDDDSTIVEPPPCTSEHPLTIKHGEHTYSCACYGLSVEAEIAGRQLLLLVLVRV